MKNYKKALAALLLICMLFALSSCKREEEPEPLRFSGWLKGDELEEIQLYSGEPVIEKNIFGKIKTRELPLTEAKTVFRGTAVELIDDPWLSDDGTVIEYEKLQLEGEVFYIKPGRFVDDINKAITEDTLYVRTSSTIYSDPNTPKISGYAKKGSKLSITGVAGIDDKGCVDMYKVSLNGTEGYVFSKYLVKTQEEADAVYNEVLNGERVADYHKDAVYYYDLYGGDPSKLDYYPVEKPVFKDNEFCKDARTMYISVYGSHGAEDYLQCAKDLGINAVCIDIFDAQIGFESETAKELCPTAYANTYDSPKAYENMVKMFKDAGFYVIGRIVTFNDSYYVADHPEDCYYSYYGDMWPSAFNRNAWYYKVSLAIEAVEKLGFNEIQFDYVRFDEYSWYKSEYGDGDYNRTYDEDKCEAVQNFLYYAADMVHRAGAYVSVDVFGEASFGYVTSYGQYWPAISNVVDAISGMPYTDHFEHDIPERWENPYSTVYNWAAGAAKLQKYTPTPAAARTWITAWDTPWWDPYVHYGRDALISQASALYDAGLNGGFLTWGGCEIWRYYEFADAWTMNY